ncbi:MAG: OmpH family outer membrane protein [Paramuribaculum sp.]|nr:OmpH family outer membrane protein [Paramuribaculum sp.]
MKKFSFFAIASLSLFAVYTSTTGCSSSADNDGADSLTVDELNVDTFVSEGDTIVTVGAPRIRFIDEDSLLANYNLAKDFQELITRSQSKLVSAQQSRENELAQLGQQIETKMRNQSYTSEQEYNADLQRAQKKQQDAQNYLANLQRTTEQEVMQMQAQITDSIEAYLKSYCKANGIDAVLKKNAAAFYFDPRFDVTNQVIQGLNARYNKVQK